MPCVALGQKKIYRASRARRRDRKILSTQPVSSDEKLKPETAELVKTAAVAVEVAEPVVSSTSTKKSKKTSKVKASHKLTRGLKRLKTTTLRRSAVKAARAAQQSSELATDAVAKDTAAKSTAPKAASAAVRLKDGDQIQIRPHRARPSTKVVAAAVTAKPTAPAASPKAARALKKNIKASTKPKRRSRFHRPSRAELINAESRLGSTIFGPVPAGHRREFFHDRENIWIWHESWVDSGHHSRQLTVRYEVRPSGVYKKLSAGKYFKLEGTELENFRKATRTYLSLIKQHIYHVA